MSKPNKNTSKPVLIMTMIIAMTGFFSYSQPPEFQLSWDKRFGGANDDYIRWFVKTSEGGLMLGGTSFSGISGDKSEPNQDTSQQTSDFWVVKTDSNGVKTWDKRYGGTASDILQRIQQTTDGGFIAGGSSYSDTGGDKSQPNWDVTLQSQDFWIVKTDSSGNKLWDRRYGGNGFELFGSIQQTPDGGYILCGSSFSGVSGDKSQPSQGSWDYWIIKTDAFGNILWDKTFGGSDDDFCNSLDLASNGGFIIGGYSQSQAGGDKSQSTQGGIDYWVVRVDDQGNKLWDKTFGGNYTDWLFDIIETGDGGFLLGGQSFSEATGDKSEPNHYPTPSGSDRWVVKIDQNGNKLWDRTFGGDKIENLSRIDETADGGFLLSGESYSNISGDKSEANLGFEQTWLLKTSSTGIFEWDKTIFSTGHDELGTAIMVDTNCFVTVNYTVADTGGYKSEFTQGNGDYWITKICFDFVTADETDDNINATWNLFPNPVHDRLRLGSTTSQSGNFKVEIIDLNGSVLMEENYSPDDEPIMEMDVSAIAAGIYFCSITDSELNRTVKKIVIIN